MKNLSNNLTLVVVAGLILVIDQLTKLYVDNSMTLYSSITVVDNFFNITYIRNPGAAFGILADSTFRIPFLVGVSVAALGAILYMLRSTPREQKFSVLALSLIFAGAAGNLIDRVRLGEVIDFLDLHWHGHHWPAFNVADSSICIGAAVLLWSGTIGGKGDKV